METQKLLNRGLSLEYMTLAWNVVGCGILLAAALSARSIALFGFGIDSVIEIFASVIVVWQLKALHTRNEKKALRCIGTAFFGRLGSQRTPKTVSRRHRLARSHMCSHVSACIRKEKDR